MDKGTTQQKAVVKEITDNYDKNAIFRAAALAAKRESARQPAMKNAAKIFKLLAENPELESQNLCSALTIKGIPFSCRYSLKKALFVIIFNTNVRTVLLTLLCLHR